jgi:hypothetical protein
MYGLLKLVQALTNIQFPAVFRNSFILQLGLPNSLLIEPAVFSIFLEISKRFSKRKEKVSLRYVKL